MAMGGDPKAIGDKLCQGFNNNEECGYDGMDCCRPIIEDSLCSDNLCRCHLTSVRHPSFKDYGCNANLHLIGDQICDDSLNTPECLYDMGDCCGGDTSFCSNCTCLEPDFVEDNTTDCNTTYIGKISCGLIVTA